MENESLSPGIWLNSILTSSFLAPFDKLEFKFKNKKAKNIIKNHRVKMKVRLKKKVSKIQLIS